MICKGQQQQKLKYSVYFLHGVWTASPQKIQDTSTEGVETVVKRSDVWTLNLEVTKWGVTTFHRCDRVNG